MHRDRRSSGGSDEGPESPASQCVLAFPLDHDWMEPSRRQRPARSRNAQPTFLRQRAACIAATDRRNSIRALISYHTPAAELTAHQARERLAAADPWPSHVTSPAECAWVSPHPAPSRRGTVRTAADPSRRLPFWIHSSSTRSPTATRPASTTSQPRAMVPPNSFTIRRSTPRSFSRTACSCSSPMDLTGHRHSSATCTTCLTRERAGSIRRVASRERNAFHGS